MRPVNKLPYPASDSSQTEVDDRENRKCGNMENISISGVN